jgi:hypothetical protein
MSEVKKTLPKKTTPSKNISPNSIFIAILFVTSLFAIGLVIEQYSEIATLKTEINKTNQILSENVNKTNSLLFFDEQKLLPWAQMVNKNLVALNQTK